MLKGFCFDFFFEKLKGFCSLSAEPTYIVLSYILMAVLLSVRLLSRQHLHVLLMVALLSLSCKQTDYEK